MIKRLWEAYRRWRMDRDIDDEIRAWHEKELDDLDEDVKSPYSAISWDNGPSGPMGI